MSEEPQSKYPRVIWTAKDGKHRIVQIEKHKYRPEARGNDDAMGNPCWSFAPKPGEETWSCATWGTWALELADDYCKVLGGE